ncbi:type 11 methyltransferase [Aquimarina agarivorans]|uniref:type 11 methyltransferase n=1 Tax=Aquimarina agarivorans TaxID=980584 RepID=UPI000248ED75|nr:type 11 methyltransferase [Aquimarina agarivorans]
MDLLESNNSNNERRHPWELARIEVVKHLITLQFPDTDFSQINVFDIGCGDAFVLEQLTTHFNFNECFGVDTALNKSDLIEINKILNPKSITIYNNLNDIKTTKNNRKSIVLLLDVIEHIEDDKGFTNSLAKNELFNTDTTFLITVPSYQKLFSIHDHYLKHYRRYTKKTLKQLLVANFQIQTSGYFFTSLLLPRILGVLKEKITKPKLITNTGLTKWQGGSNITKIVTKILFIDYLISLKVSKTIPLPGLSTYAVCKKSV